MQLCRQTFSDYFIFKLCPNTSQSDDLFSGGGGQVDLLEDGRRPRDRQQADQEEEVEKDRPEPVRHFRIKHSAKV